MYNVSESIISSAKKCDKRLMCLSNTGKPYCKIGNCVNNKVLFLTKLERVCPYYLEFGYGHICNCPVRKEIFRIYGEWYATFSLTDNYM